MKSLAGFLGVGTLVFFITHWDEFDPAFFLIVGTFLVLAAVSVMWQTYRDSQRAKRANDRQQRSAATLAVRQAPPQ